MWGDWSGRLTEAFDDGPRIGMVALCLIGAAMAAWAGAVSLSIGRTIDALVFLAVVVCLLVFGRLLARRSRFAEAVSAVALLGCIPGMAGTAVQLVVGVDSAKASELVALGVEPRVGVAINLAYFVLGAVLAIWLASRLWSGR